MSRYPYSQYRILQFSKAPQAGKVKTRMASCLDYDQCAELHAALTEQVFCNLRQAQLCPQQLWVAGDPWHAFFRTLIQGTDIQIQPQVDGDLGERLAAATQQCLAEQDVSGVLLVGSDCPSIDRAYLLQAVRALASGQDAVIGPACDGGYVLLGLSRFEASLFEHIDWGTERVADQTCLAMDRLNWRYTELAVLPDIDRPEDLARLAHAAYSPQLQSFAHMAPATNQA